MHVCGGGHMILHTCNKIMPLLEALVVQFQCYGKKQGRCTEPLQGRCVELLQFCELIQNCNHNLLFQNSKTKIQPMLGCGR